jgi:hypothetical protein
VLESPARRRRSSFAGLMKSARGTVASEIPDLGSNPAHLAGLGHKRKKLAKR